MARQLGLSDSILTMIERRGRGDWLIFVGLAIGLLVFMYVLIYYVKPAISVSNLMWVVGGGDT